MSKGFNGFGGVNISKALEPYAVLHTSKPSSGMSFKLPEHKPCDIKYHFSVALVKEGGHKFDVLGEHSKAAGYKTSWSIPLGQLEFSFVFDELDTAGLIDRRIET